MKTFNLIKWLWTDSHEKQSPQRFARFAAMLIMLLTLGVGQMWADSSVTSASIKYDVNASTAQWWNVSSTPKDLGQVYTFKLKGFWAKVGSDNVCQNTCIYYGLTNACSMGNYNIQDPKDNNWTKPVHFQTESMNVDILSGRTPDKYILYAKFIGHGTKGSNSCADLSSSTYQMKFEYPAYLTGDGTWCGTEWNTTADAQKMTYNAGGYYTKTISSVTKADHKLKVSTYDWASSWGHAKYDATNSSNVCSESNASGNIQFQPAMAGDVTIKFNISDQKISIICAAPTITLDDEGGSGGDGSLNTYYGEAPTSVTVPERDGYSFAGYWTGDDGTGTQVIGANGAWLKNVSNYTNNDATWKWIVRANSTLHAKWTQDPTLTMSGVSATSIVSGESVTITVVRGNSSANITYQYKIGTGSWNDIATVSDQSYTYTPEANNGDTKTYYFRAKMTDGTTITTDASPAVKQYGKKTIKVKDSNNWGANFRIHRWGGDASGTSWPGETANITSAGGQWKQVVLYSSSVNFLFDKSSDPDHNKTANQTYAGVNDGDCYVIGTTAGGSMSFTSGDCPSAPTVTTGDATASTSTSVQFPATVTSFGNDKTTYGVAYYKVADQPTAATIYGSGTKVQISNNVNANNTTASTSAQTITAGTNYWYVAYAFNGQESGAVQYGDVKFLRTTAVTLNKKEGTSGSGNFTAFGGRAISNLTKPSLTGNTFAGYWTSENDESGTKYFNANGSAAVTNWPNNLGASLTLYAHWTPQSYTITYSPASSSYFTYTVKPSSGTYNTTVSVTITPNQNYKITSVTAKKTDDASTSVYLTHTTGTNVWTFTQPAYGVTLTTTAASYGLTASISSKSYENRTFTLSKSSTYNPEGTLNTNWFVYYVCTSKPDGATCTINQTTGVATVDKDGDYTFKAQYRTASGGSGTLLAESSGVTSAMRTIPDRSGLTIGHARYNTTYMSGNGASATPYFVYLSRAAAYGKLNLTATLPAALASEEQLWYSVNGTEKGQVTVAGTAASVTMDLPDKSVGAGRTAAIKFYSKLDGQTAPDAKKASATVYYTVCANPVVTVSATYNDSPIAGEIPQNATIVVSASATNISGTPTFQYKKGSGSYSSTTEYTLEAAGTTTMYAKTTALGDTWSGSLNVTTYAANAVTYVTSKTDMYGDVATTSTSRLFKSSGEEHTAAEIAGYTFTGWTCTGDNVKVSDNSGSTWKTTSSNATVYVKATAAGSTLTASYTENKRIYFDNSKAKWTGDIYVYFFSGDAWYNDYNGTDKNGPGVVPRLASRIGYGQMTRIGSSDVYYYEYGALSFTRVAFSVGNQYNYDMLYNTKGAWRTDFSSCNPCYVAPETSDQTKYNTGGSGKSGDNKPTYYYNNGYWRRYMPAKSGYTLHFADQEVAFLPEDPSVDAENFKVTVLRAASTTYPIYVNNSCMSKTWKNASAITKDNCSNLTLTQTSGTCNFTTTAEGDYVFRLSTANGQVKLTVEYPLSTGDYQVYYTDNTGKNNNYSNYIRKNSSGSTKNDTVSFFVKKTASPTFQIKRCTGFSGSTPTWENVGSATAISVAKDSVYNLIFQQNGTGTTISKVGQEFYSGNYYIRTDGAAGGWGNYLSNPDNKMKHTDKASALAAGYNYYYLRWIGDASGNSTANVKFCIATDYNNCVSQEHGNDPADGSLSGGQALTGKGANVRFTYHPGTNTTTRTCVGGSAHDSQYLVINGTNLETSGGASWAGRTKMTDMNDWIYTYELKAANGATITLESHYNDKYVTILPTKTVLEVGDAAYYDLRIVYDYKTNEVVAAYIPSTVSSNLTIDVDIMFIRQAKDNHESAPTTTLTLSGGAKITGDPKTLYGAIKFEKDYVRAEGSYSGLVTRRPERSTYWISFPFDVRIKDIFGLGDYTETWIIQRYRGDSRASKGWFLDTKTFWEYVMDENYVMKAGQGYVLSIDCEAIQWPNNQTTQYLYFPSKDKISDITSVLPSASMNVPEHTCSITSPADRTVKDSHWNVIGIPGFADAWGRATEDVSVIGGNLKYFYTWAPSTNTLSTTSTRKYNFKFMHSYMVQYYGNIDWSASEPAAIVAKRSSGTLQEEVEFCIDLMKDSIKEDNAFVTLMDNNRATTDFDMNTDLVKMLNAKNANIYTIINSDIQAAANCLPMTEQTTIVPVGVDIKTNGDYTFAIPDGTSGVGVTLIDTENNIRTSLSALSYTVNLTAGTHDGRFLLEIAPIQQTPTDIEEVTGDGLQVTGVRKVLIDQQMYIIRDGKMYDARGARVQ